MAHPRLAGFAGFDRTLLTAGAAAVLVTAPLAASAGAEALDTGGGGGVPVTEVSAVQEASAPADQAAAAAPAAEPVATSAAPAGQAAADPAPAPVVEAAPAAQPPADAEPAAAEGPIDDVTEAAQQAVDTVAQTAAAAQEAVAGVVGGAPVQPPPGAPLPGGPEQPQDPGPGAQPANPPPGTVRTVTGPSSTVTPAGGPVTTLPVAPAGGLSAFAGPDFTTSAGLGGGFGSGSGPLLQPFAAPVFSVPFITDVPQIAEDAFTDTGAPAAGDRSTAATPFDGVVPANAPAWLLTTAAGLLLLVGAGHVLRAKAQPSKS